MFDNSIVNETSPDANWNRQTGGPAGRQTGAQDYVLSQADALAKNCALASTTTSTIIYRSTYLPVHLVGVANTRPLQQQLQT